MSNRLPDRLLNDRLDWNLLRTYLVIGQEGSMSRAAARLHITQSAVSQALKRLEEQLDCVLIARSGRRFELTETGRKCCASPPISMAIFPAWAPWWRAATTTWWARSASSPSAACRRRTTMSSSPISMRPTRKSSWKSR